ncbi:M15 family metallopeptidase [Trichothermofontia sp.]
MRMRKTQATDDYDNNLEEVFVPLEHLRPFRDDALPDDIPEALREMAHSRPHQLRQRRLLLFLSLFSLGVLAFGFGVGLNLVPQWADSAGSAASSSQRSGTSMGVDGKTGVASPGEEALLGHLAYAEAPPESLTAITADGSLKLRTAAADKFLAMQTDARAAGVELVPLSAYRSQQDQEHLFFDVKAARGQNPTERAEVSAPPGHSEHHTGYAIDIGDGAQPETHLQFSFAETAAFQWLQENAAYYNFELSFPENNPQGVAYEPWHWRFVGDRDSLETFYKARQLRQETATSP